MLFFIFKITEWCNGMVGYSEMLNKIWNKCKMHLVIAALLLWFSLKHKVLSSLQTISGLKLVENRESIMYEKRVVLTN